jgi:hypothetical protein
MKYFFKSIAAFKREVTDPDGDFFRVDVNSIAIVGEDIYIKTNTYHPKNILGWEKSKPSLSKRCCRWYDDAVTRWLHIITCFSFKEEFV